MNWPTFLFAGWPRFHIGWAIVTSYMFTLGPGFVAAAAKHADPNRIDGFEFGASFGCLLLACCCWFASVFLFVACLIQQLRHGGDS